MTRRKYRGFIYILVLNHLWQDPGFPSVNNQEIPWDFGLSTETPRARKAKPQLRPTPWRWGFLQGNRLRDGLLPKKNIPRKRPKKILPVGRLEIFFWGYRYIHHDGTLCTPLNRYVCRLSHEKDKVMNSRKIFFVSGKSRLVTYYL